MYYGKKSNVVVKAALEDYDIDGCPGSLKSPSRKDISKRKTGIKNIRERAKSYTQKLEKRIMERQMRTNPASTSTKLEKKY